MNGCAGVLALVDPDGCVRRVTFLGSGCPEFLRLPALEASAPWGLVVLAPHRSSACSSNWMDRSARAEARGLAADGLVYLLAPVGAPRRARGVQARAGLTVGCCRAIRP